MSVEVRVPRADEAEAVARCQLDCWRDAYAGLVDPARLGPSLDDVAANVERWHAILAGPARVRVAVEDGRLVGFATVRPGADGAPDHLAALYTRRAHWSTGLGQRLLDAVLGGAPATLRVFRDNERAVRFYARNGFVPDGYEGEEPHWGGVEIGMVRTGRSAHPR
ncbi:GNAT family N-acetyltransferase [Microlunatus flavus]|uniref:Acetyltransferase (GNAT) family protein n=1 Tax=Microlunatus flavus TaxID=1036181 RepID=A0A1H9EWA5_9ACTN|nr:GNAT family N-acetyltransferase [Microlunatus flavus]SEQ29941.1 Acetyltransferase (GNAT) family protein [Microlunatus flavus]